MTLDKFLRLPVAERLKVLNVTREEWLAMPQDERLFVLKMSVDKAREITDHEIAILEGGYTEEEYRGIQ